MTIYAAVQIVRGMAFVWSGSGGLGAVSFDPVEIILEFLVMTGIVWGVIYWRSRRSPPNQS